MAEPPTTSVCMAAYNAAKFLETALDSLLAQTYAHFELIVVDDGSCDDTAKIVRRYARTDARIEYLRNETNRGLVYTRNRLLQECSTPLIAVADADDVFHPRRLENQLQFLEKHPECGVIGAGVEFLDQGEGRLPSLAVHAEDRHIRFFMHLTPAFWNTTTLYRRELLEQAGGYREGFEAGAEDYDLWARLLPLTRFANLPEPLVKVRVHPASVTAEGSKCLRNVLKVSARLLQNYLRRPVPIELREELHRFLMHSGMDGPDCERAFALARALYNQAVRVEAPDTIQLLRDKLADASWTQARYLVYAAPSLSRGLAITALRWKPSLLWQGGTYAYAARSLAPRPTIAFTKRLLRTFRARETASPSTRSGEKWPE